MGDSSASAKETSGGGATPSKAARESHHLLRWRRVVVADIIGGARVGPGHRGVENGGDVLDMDAREDLARLLDAFGLAAPHRVERTASRPVDAGEPEEMNRQAVELPEREPGRFGGDAAAAALAARAQRCRSSTQPPARSP